MKKKYFEPDMKLLLISDVIVTSGGSENPTSDLGGPEGTGVEDEQPSDPSPTA